MFKNFLTKKPYFLYRKKKSSVLVFSDTLIQFANQDIASTMGTVLEYIPEETLFTTHKDIKALGLLSLSYHIACFLHSVSVNAQLSDEIITEIKTDILKQILAIENDKGAIWSQSDVPLFEQQINNDLVLISSFSSVVTGDNLSHIAPGDSFIEEVIKHYELSPELLSDPEKQGFANKLHDSITTALSAFDGGAVKWVT